MENKDFPTFIKEKHNLEMSYHEEMILYHDEQIYWWAATEEKYKAFEKKLDALGKETDDFRITVSYDVSGFEYWMKDRKEHNYANINVTLKHKEIRDPDALADTIEDVWASLQ